MKLIAPDYYPDFYCIADRCKHSCCIGWEIDIDEETLEKYRLITDDFGDLLRKEIEIKEDTACFRLSENERCPFLNKNGLCDIILTLGDDYLSQICTDHPRFCSFLSDRTEIGLGLCCEAAGKLILEKKEKTSLIILEDDDACEELNDFEKLILKKRNHFFEILQNREISVEKRMARLLFEAEISLPNFTFSEWTDIYLSLERMNDSWGTLLLNIKNENKKTETFAYNTAFEQLLHYFVYRHLFDACDESELAERIGFCVLSVWMIEEICKRCASFTLEKMIEICRLYSSEIEYSSENTQALLEIIKNKGVLS